MIFYQHRKDLERQYVRALRLASEAARECDDVVERCFLRTAWDIKMRIVAIDSWLAKVTPKHQSQDSTI